MGANPYCGKNSSISFGFRGLDGDKSFPSLILKHRKIHVLENILTIGQYQKTTGQQLVTILATASQRQIADIPELLRLPHIQELTEIKAEIFSLSSSVAQIYDHLGRFFINQNPKEIAKIDRLNAKLTKSINEKFQDLILNSYLSDDKLKSFFLSFVTRVQSIKSKLREVRKLSVDYFGEAASNELIVSELEPDYEAPK